MIEEEEENEEEEEKEENKSGRDKSRARLPGASDFQFGLVIFLTYLPDRASTFQHVISTIKGRRTGEYQSTRQCTFAMFIFLL